MGVSVTPPAAVNLADNPKNRLYRATQSGTYSVSIPAGVYEVTRQATTNIIIGSTTVTPSTMMSLIFVNEAQSSITFNSTVSGNVVPWASVTFNRGTHASFLQFIGGQYFLSPNNGFVYSVSTNGVSWTNRTYYSVNNEGSANEISFGNGQYVQPLTGDNNGPNRVRTSTNLIGWSGRGGSNRMVASRFANGYFVLAGRNDASTAGVIGRDTSGTSWVTDRYTTITSGQYFLALEFGNGLFVAGTDLGSIFTSTNAATWTVRQSVFAGNAIRRILYANGIFMAVGVNGTITTSTDGISWELKPFNETLSLTNVVFAEDQGIWIVSDGGTALRYSPDNGNTWVARTAGSPVSGTTLLYNDGKLFYVSNEASVNLRVSRAEGSVFVFNVPTVLFTDTYIILEYKGKTKVLS